MRGPAWVQTPRMTIKAFILQCARMEFFMSILQYEYLRINDILKTNLKLKHITNTMKVGHTYQPI